MPARDTIELIVLSTTPVGENALVVHTLSREWGRRGFLVPSARKAGTARFLPLNILEAQVVENPKSELWSLRNITPRDALSGIRDNIHKNTMSLFLAEVLLRTLKEGTCEEGLFEWCVGSILTLNALEADFYNYHIRFLIDFAGALGGENRNALCEALLKYLTYHTDSNIHVRSLQVLRELYR